MSRFSVKRPYTVIVAVLIVILLGIVSFTRLSTDLLPSMELPYAIVLTTYQGASPEQVETVVTEPVESTMATVSNIKHISSTSSENLSLVVMEFNTNANMDSVTIEMRESLDMIESYWPDEVGSPIIMKLNPEMMPVMVAAVHGDGLSQAEVTDIYNNHISQDIESMEGVASVSATGLVNASVQVVLSDERIEELNDQLMDKIHEQFEDAQREIDDARAEIESGRAQLESGKTQAAEQMAQAEAEISSGKDKAVSGEAQLAVQSSQIDAQETQLLEAESQLLAAEEQLNQLSEQEAQLNAAKASLEQTIAELSATKEQIESAKAAAEADGVDVETQYQALLSQRDELQAQIDALTGDTTIPDEQKAPQLELLNTAMTQLTEGITQMETLIAGINQLPQIESGLAEAQEALPQVTDNLTKIAEGKALIESQLGDVDARKAQIQAGKDAIATGRQALTQAQEQIDAGKVSLNEALAKLNEQRYLASIEMSVADASLSMGNVQLEQSETQLDATKDTALESADITGILTTDMVAGILTAQNFSMPAGYITEDGVDYLVRIGDSLKDTDEIENLVVMDLSDQDLGVIYLKDVADIAVTDNSKEVYAKMNGESALLISVEKQNGYSTADVAKKVREYISSDKVAGYGVEIMALMDQGIYIDYVIESVLHNLIIGAVLAIIILFIFLKDIRPTFVVAISIPISVIFALALMYFTGVTMNIISLSGLALGVGMLVDNSIVVIENIYRMRNQGVPVRRAAIEGAKQVTAAIAASTLTTVCIWVPIIFVEGITRQLFVDLVLTIAYSLLASLIVALTVVPMLASTMLRNVHDRPQPLFNKMLNLYEKALRWSLRHKAVVIVAVFVLLIGSILSVVTRGFEFMGDMDSPQISASVQMDEDTTFDEASEMADTVMDRIMAVDGVSDVGAMLGSSLSLMSTMGGETATDSITFYVILDDDRSMTSDEVAQAIVDNTADLDCEVSANGSTIDLSALGGSGVSVMIKGRDIDTLKKIASDYAAELEKIEGTTEVSDGQERPSKELRVTVDKEEAMKHNLTVAQVYQQIAALVATPTATSTLTTDTDDFEIYVKDSGNEAMTRDDVRDLVLTVSTQTGETEEVALKDIAKITETEGLSSIQRDAQQRQITVSCMVDSEHNATLVTNEFKRAISRYTLPEGYSVEFAGENEIINEAFGQLGQLLFLGIIIMYLIMVAQFQSLLSPFIVMFTIPLAFTGGFLGLLVTGNRLSVIGMVGFIMLCGVIVNNGIVFVDYVNQLRDSGVPKIEALVETGRTRMRPILMTALTTILAMSTMALGFGEGSEMVQPMAIVTIGGMIYGTLLTLFLVPVVYDLFNRRERRVFTADDGAEAAVDSVREITGPDVVDETVGATAVDEKSGADDALEMTDPDVGNICSAAENDRRDDQ